jgi:hypothetical protein
MYPSLVETILIFKSKKAIVSKFRVYYKIHTIFPSNCQIGPFLSFREWNCRAARLGQQKKRLPLTRECETHPQTAAACFAIYALSFAIFMLYCSP